MTTKSKKRKPSENRKPAVPKQKVVRPHVNGNSTMRVPASVLRLATFADIESTRYRLGGICFVVEDHKLEVVATDARRLVVLGMPNHVANPDCDFSLRAADLSTALGESDTKRALKACGEREFDIAVGDKLATITSETSRSSTTVRAELIEGRFPKYREVIPTSPPEKLLHFNARMLGEILMMMHEFTTEAARAVAIEVRGGDEPLVLRLSAGSTINGVEVCAAIMPIKPGATPGV